MEIIVKGYFFDGVLEPFTATVTKETAIKARGRLEIERRNIINHLRKLQEQGEIKSVFRPKNKKIQQQLNDLVKAKKILKESVEKIRMIF